MGNKGSLTKSNRKRAVTPEVFQMEAVECGAACLLMILKYYGRYLPLEEVREACAVSRNGCNAASIVLAGQRFGLIGKGFSCDIARLHELPKPCILHWDFKHFVVLESIGKKHAWINDPAHGHRKVTIEELDQAFTGVVLCFSKGPEFKREGKEKSIPLALYEMIKGERKATIFLLLAGLGLVFAGLLFPVLTQVFVDDVMEGIDKRWLVIIITGMAFVYLSQMVLSYMKDGVLSRLKIKLTLYEDARLVEWLLKLPVSFFEQRFAGEVSQREEAVSRLYAFASGALADTVLNLFQASFYFLLMLLYSPILTLISLTGVLMCMVTFRYSMRILKGYALKQTQDKNRMMGLLCSGLSVFSSVKAGGAENDLVSLLSNNYMASAQSAQRFNVAQQIIGIIPGAIAQMMNVTVLMVGAVLVIKGDITEGILFAFCQFLGLLLQPVMSLLSLQQQIQTLKADLNVLEDASKAKEDFRFIKEDVPDTEEPESELLTGLMEASGLTFGYDVGEAPFIRNFNLKVMPGSFVGIVGSSGSGKSTVGKLISGLLNCWQGSVKYDEMPVTEIPNNLMTNCISVVSQKEAFFAASIRDNLTLWDGRYTENELFRALADAEALDLVNALPGGLDYKLAEGAGNFSGGQRQQLAIARALLSDPSILILDEATSAMDALREKEVMDNLKRRNCTVIVIAHRLSSVVNSDIILVMENGAVKEAGNHDKLISHGGLYAKLYQAKES